MKYFCSASDTQYFPMISTYQECYSIHSFTHCKPNIQEWNKSKDQCKTEGKLTVYPRHMDISLTKDEMKNMCTLQ